MLHSRSRMTMLAGWLFADLFLFLLIAGLAVVPARPAATTVGQSPSPSPSPSPTQTHPAGLDPHVIDFAIPLSPDAFRAGATTELLDEVDTELSQLDPGHRPVGFVIVLATDDLYHVNRATATATNVLKLLRSRSPYFSVAQGLGYWDGPGDDFEFKIFLLN